MAAISAGELDRRVTLQRSIRTANALNEPVDTWSDLAANVAAKRLDVTGAERVRAAAVQGEVSTTFVVRWSRKLVDLNDTDRLLFEGRVFNIGKVFELGRRVGLTIEATATSDGDGA